MSQLHDRVVERLVAAQNARDPTPLRGEDAVGDALALLREAAPSPDGEIDLGAVAAVCWTFWLRHQGAEDPEAQQNVTIATSTVGFLCPRVSEGVPLPEPLRDAFDATDPAHEARFAYLMGSAHGDFVLKAPDLGESDRLAALDRALAWSDTARRCLPEGHEGFVELALNAVGLNVMRFHLAADPDSLAVAARSAAAVCERLPSAGPAEAEGAPLAFEVLVNAARLLGEPSLAEVERLVAAAPHGALPPEAADALRLLRELHAEPATWPGALDMRAGAAIAHEGIRQQDASLLACGARRLRAALAHTPADHPAHAHVTAALGQTLAAFARARGDDAAAREAAELLAASAPRTSSEADQALLAGLRGFAELIQDDDPGRLRDAGPMLGQLLDQLRERAARNGVPELSPDIEIAAVVFDIATAVIGNPDGVTDERLARYRAALAALPADQPHRYAYVAMLAALASARAQALRETEPTRAAQLAAEAESLTDEAAADAPPDFPPLGLLRRGDSRAALAVAVLAIPTDEPDDGVDLRAMAPGNPLVAQLADILDSMPETAAEAKGPELARTAALLSALDGVRLDDPDRLDSDIASLRDLLANTAADDGSIHPLLAGALGVALTAHGMTHRDPATVDEAVPMLRYAHSQAPGQLEGLDPLLAFALTTRSLGRFDAEAAREAAALLAASATEEPTNGTDQTVQLTRIRFFNAMGNYLFGHEAGQLERARESAEQLKDLASRADPQTGDHLAGLDMFGDALLNMVEITGPGGGLKRDISDDQVDQCRRAFEACPADHPLRSFTASTLARALLQRAATMRATDPERAEELVAEANTLPLDETQRQFASAFGQGRLPELSTSDRPPSVAPPEAATTALQAMTTLIRTRLSGAADPAAFRAALRDPLLPVWSRAHAELGAAGGALAMKPPRIDTALSHLEAGIEAMAQVTDRGSDQQSAEYGLTSFEGDIRHITELVLLQALVRQGTRELHDRMVALQEHREPDPVPESLLSVVTGPDVDRATALLERGRGLLLARQLEARADLSELRSAHPELARGFERLSDQLAAEPDALAAMRPDENPPTTGRAEWSRLAKLRASRELDELIERIRTEPGFDDFLRPLSAQQLRQLAADGPIVVLNHAQRYCHALVVTARSITALRLEAESAEISDAARRQRDAIDAINAYGLSRPSPAQLVAAGATVRETLSWTWHRIVRPVLDLVGSSDAVADGAEWPRIWWVPTGPFNALPLHAAQCTLPDCVLDGCGAALDAVVSSYVPGFQTLAHARSRAADRHTADSGRALLVAAAEDDLPGAAAAAGLAAERLAAPAPLIGAAATREAVLAALGAAAWTHFGCHATTDPAQPSGSLLHLPSGEHLSVLDICRARPHVARLAFLTACGTARTSERLADEAVHITSAFLIAGFPEAVGTLWEIDSTHAEHVTREFYRRVAGGGMDTPACALHNTIREVRRQMPDRPHVWAAYVHAGT
ncbi:CHAT domain-containing protein [Streptomyces sp. NPDC054933]